MYAGRTRLDGSVISDVSLCVVHISPENREVVRPGSSQRGSREARSGLRRRQTTPFEFVQAACLDSITHPPSAKVIPRIFRIMETFAVTTCILQGMARVRSGQAPAWPLSSDRSVRRGYGIKRDFACTVTRHFLPVLVARRPRSPIRLEGRTRTISGPSPDVTSSVPGLLSNLAHVRRA